MRVFTGQADEDAWNKGKIPLMAIHPASGGHGVNLADGGRAIAHYSHGWDLELKIQVNGRNGVVRQMQGGYDRAVLQYEICAKDTIDEVVLARQTTKASIQDALMEARAHRGNA
jgi:SNF2 family DNA or RNA helicase